LSTEAVKTPRAIRLGQLAAAMWLAATAYAYLGLVRYQPRRIVADPIEAFFFEAGDTSPQISYLVFLFFIYNRRHALRRAAAEPGLPLAGSAVLLLGVLDYAWGSYVAQIDLLLDAFVLCSVGGALLLGGRRLLGQLAVPLLYLWLARPIPPALALVIHDALIELAGTATYGLVALIDLPHMRTGNLIHFDGRWFHIIDSCSGFRITHTMITSALIYAEIFGLASRRRWLLVAAAIPIGIVVNTGRIVGIILNPWSEGQLVHSTQGLVMLVIGVLMLPLVDRIHVRWWSAKSEAAESELEPGADVDTESPSWSELLNGPRKLPALIAVSLGAIATAALSAAPLQGEKPKPDRWRAYALERYIVGWQMMTVEMMPREHLGVAGFDDFHHVVWQRDEDEVRVLLAVTDRSSRHHSGLTPKLRVPGEGWEIRDKSTVELPWPGQVERLVVGRGHERRLAYFWRYGELPVVVEALRWAIAYDLAPWRTPGSALIVRLDTPIGDHGEAGAERVLEAFLETLEPAILSIEPAGPERTSGTQND
jgi:exosortase